MMIKVYIFLWLYCLTGISMWLDENSSGYEVNHINNTFLYLHESREHCDYLIDKWKESQVQGLLSESVQ